MWHVRLVSIKLKLDQKNVPIVVPIQIHRKEALLRQNVLVMWATRVPTAAHVMLAWQGNINQLPVVVPVLTVQGIQIHQQQVTNRRTVLATRDIQDQMVGRVRRARRASTKSTLVLWRVMIAMGMLTRQGEALSLPRVSVLQDIQDQTGVLVRPVEKTNTRQVLVQIIAKHVQIIQATPTQHRRPRPRVSATPDTVAPMVVLVRRVRSISTRPGSGRPRVMIVTRMPIRQLPVHPTRIVHVTRDTSETDTQRAPSAGRVRMENPLPLSSHKV